MAYKLVVTKSAKSDLRKIVSYIKNDLSAPKAAADFLMKVKKCYGNIVVNPFIYTEYKADIVVTKTYRRALIGNYLMFYRIDNKNGIIYISNFFHGSQDYTKLL